jgi:hypothetical protein
LIRTNKLYVKKEDQHEKGLRINGQAAEVHKTAALHAGIKFIKLGKLRSDQARIASNSACA